MLTAQGPTTGRLHWDDPGPDPSRTIAGGSGRAAGRTAAGRRRAVGGPPRRTEERRGEGRKGTGPCGLLAFWPSYRLVLRSSYAPSLGLGFRSCVLLFSFSAAGAAGRRRWCHAEPCAGASGRCGAGTAAGLGPAARLVPGHQGRARVSSPGHRRPLHAAAGAVPGGTRGGSPVPAGC